MSPDIPVSKDGRRFHYELVTYGDAGFEEPDFETLAQAIGVMASEGWRFVETTEHHAVFEKPA